MTGAEINITNEPFVRVVAVIHLQWTQKGCKRARNSVVSSRRRPRGLVNRFPSQLKKKGNKKR